MTPLYKDKQKLTFAREAEIISTDENNLVYTSVTTLLDKYKNKFDNNF
jgi:hypothetical protein